MLNLFCSHSWDYMEDRQGLHGLIHPVWQKNVDWRDLSVPREHPLHGRSNLLLQMQLEERIERCDVLLAFAGMYSSYSDWIEFEVQTASVFRKPVLAIRPRGQERLPRFITDNASEVVNWNGKSVREAILRALPSDRRLVLGPQLRESEFNHAFWHPNASE